MVKPSRWRSRAGEDSGAATVLAAFAVAGLVALSAGVILAGSAVIARHRAQSAADLAALAAAQRLPAGPDAACRMAHSVGLAVGAQLDDCAIRGLDVVVTCVVRVGGWPGVPARATARAGPVAVS